MDPLLTKTEVRGASRALKAVGRKLPKVGWCLRLPMLREGQRKRTPPADMTPKVREAWEMLERLVDSRVEICHHSFGYDLTGSKSRDRQKLAALGRKKR